MTNQQKFIEIFGIDAWQQMIVFSGLAEQFKEYWTSPYNEMDCSCGKECEEKNHTRQKVRNKDGRYRVGN